MADYSTANATLFELRLPDGPLAPSASVKLDGMELAQLVSNVEIRADVDGLPVVIIEMKGLALDVALPANVHVDIRAFERIPIVVTDEPDGGKRYRAIRELPADPREIWPDMKGPEDK
jgi:hypothetical protein